MNVCGWEWVMVDSRIGDMSAPSTFNISCQIAPGRTISPHCLSRGLKNVRKSCWVIWPVLWLWVFWYFDILPQIPLSLPLTNIVLKRPVKIFWNCCQASKYGVLVKRTKRDRILISMFACWATLSMWHKPLEECVKQENPKKHEEKIHFFCYLDFWKCDAVAHFWLMSFAN